MLLIIDSYSFGRNILGIRVTVRVRKGNVTSLQESVGNNLNCLKFPPLLPSMFKTAFDLFVFFFSSPDRMRNNAGAYNMYGLLLEHQKLFFQAEKAFDRCARFYFFHFQCNCLHYDTVLLSTFS